MRGSSGSIHAALEASHAADESNGKKKLVAIGIRMTEGQHEHLKDIVYWTEKKTGESVSLNSLLVEGVERVIEDRKAKGIVPDALHKTPTKSR